MAAAAISKAGGHKLFVYGTLMHEDVLSICLQGARRGLPHAEIGTLHGYRRQRIHGREYPTIIPASTSTCRVSGLILFDLTDADLVYLDDYEGDEYKRIECDVVQHGAGAKDTPVHHRCYVYTWDADTKVLYDDWIYEEHFLPIADKYVQRLKKGSL